MTVCAYLALGSNIGNREETLRQAIRQLHEQPGIRVSRVSFVYETDPVGYIDQEAFLNMVVAVETEFSADQLLETALSVEKELGRVRTIRWGPRTIDIDVLLYGQYTIENEHLKIPHPAMAERAFVLVPLRDVWEGGALPVYNQTIDHFLLQLAEDHKGVRKWGAINWEIESGPFES
ncbi:2-amino-4-hydroxy-6-hydroxymethyldihydropteridine diphosphokinase [Brevibacillus choshinensis]|uniref:2-amino-4-hydroxy-6- hydroxymethyldihydropteridine diphosphokinase n=1 Tax=Brevibacillus choshinensis TaxID=54911 RepID=UPI002E251CA5|nr:2-amino-4-hydroxy-6-hydroxymethyldihydropteridine diphosphokinase [Brevibacillus choshinensis]MED4754895.1 2-amino-4-hydroxy-6-hydroxymethyldihydropteridine diphosphokinase [Brevibacillus choshinensis]MED4781263.1 2-amino-4-hydroxy-6-hydroxymethyldihydropteridine diphosphokinase [Brevibacillus choshinensis]